VPVNEFEGVPSNSLIPSATASGSCQSSVDLYDLSSDDEEYLMPKNGAEKTPGQSDCAAR